jgi:hypothetical protein
MDRLTRKRIYKKKRGGAVEQFFDELGSSVKGLVSRTRKKGAELIEQGSTVVSSAVKGTETAVSNVGQNISSATNQVKTTTQQMMGGKKHKSRKSRKSRKSKKMGKSRKSRKSKKH